MGRIESAAQVEHSQHRLPGATSNANNREYGEAKLAAEYLIARSQTPGAVSANLNEHPCALLVFNIRRARCLRAPATRTPYDGAPGARQHINVIDCLYVNPMTEMYSQVDR